MATIESNKDTAIKIEFLIFTTLKVMALVFVRYKTVEHERAQRAALSGGLECLVVRVVMKSLFQIGDSHAPACPAQMRVVSNKPQRETSFLIRVFSNELVPRRLSSFYSLVSSFTPLWN